MTPTLRVLVASASALAFTLPAAARPRLVAQSSDSHFLSAQDELERLLELQPNVREAKNVILFVGDGMSIPTVTAARIRAGQELNQDGESHHLAFEDLLTHIALAKTYTHDAQVADSAPTATAMVAGVKANNGTIGVTQTVENDVCASQKGHEVTTIFELAESAGYATGIVSTARITHATPAATYAKTAQRDWENDSQLSEEAKANGCKDIAAQLVDWSAGNGFEVILGRIDHAHHAGNAYRALGDTIALDDAVKAAYEMVDPEETLIIVTADHGHVFTIAGYPVRNNPILGLVGELADDDKPYTTLGYMNGPGAVVGERADLSDVDTAAPDFLQQALVPLEASETHSGDDVAIYAQGPWAHLFEGVVEQNLIYHVIAHATGLPSKAALSAVSN